MMLFIPGIALRAQQGQDCSLPRSGLGSLNSIEAKVESVKLLSPCQKVNSSEIISSAVCQLITPVKCLSYYSAPSLHSLPLFGI